MVVMQPSGVDSGKWVRRRVHRVDGDGVADGTKMTAAVEPDVPVVVCGHAGDCRQICCGGEDLVLL